MFSAIVSYGFILEKAYHREKLMKKEGKAVTLLVAENKEDFIKKWNQMGLDSDGKEEYKISNVYTAYHGSYNGLIIVSKKNQMDKDDPDLELEDGERTFYASDAYKLKNKKIDVLNLTSCMNGNLDFINRWSYEGTEYGQNMAVRMMKSCMGIKTVKAWDGLATYIPADSGIEYCGSHSVFRKWSIQKNGTIRDVTGLITYKRESDGSISYSPAVKYLYVLGVPEETKMTEKIS